MQRHFGRVVRYGWLPTVAVIAVLVSDMPSAIKNVDRNIHDILANLGFDNPPSGVASYVWHHPLSFILLWFLVFAVGVLLSWGIEAGWNRLTGVASRSDPSPASAFRYDDHQQNAVAKAKRPSPSRRGSKLLDSLSSPIPDSAFEDLARRLEGEIADRKATHLDDQRRKLISDCRDMAHEFVANEPNISFREFLEGKRVFADVRAHLSDDYSAKLNAQRTIYAMADGAKYEPRVEWFFDEIDRLAKEWNLSIMILHIYWLIINYNFLMI